jgi:hypothetical protein
MAIKKEISHVYIHGVLLSYLIFLLCLLHIHADKSEQSNFGVEAPAFVDCSISCTFPSSYSVKPSTQAIFLILPAVFTMTFQYQVASNPSSSSLANIFDIYSYSLAQSILSLSMEPGTNQMRVIFNNSNVMTYGPGVTFSSSAFTTFTLQLTPKIVTLSNGVYSDSNNVRGVLFGSNSVMYISTNFMRTAYVSAGGVVKNIQITGLFSFHYSFFVVGR